MSSEVHNRNRAKEGGGGGVLIARNPMGRPSVYWPPGQPCNWPLEGRGSAICASFLQRRLMFIGRFSVVIARPGFFFPRPCDNVAPHVRQLYDSGDWTQSVTPDRADGRWASSAFTCSLTCYIWLQIQFKWTEMNLINFKFWFKRIKYFFENPKMIERVLNYLKMI